MIVEAFAGSGASLTAAEQIGRGAFCIDIEPRHVDVATGRWRRYSGGQSFDEVLMAHTSKPPSSQRAEAAETKKARGGR